MSENLQLFNPENQPAQDGDRIAKMVVGGIVFEQIFPDKMPVCKNGTTHFDGRATMLAEHWRMENDFFIAESIRPESEKRAIEKYLTEKYDI